MDNKVDMSPASLAKGEKSELEYGRGQELGTGDLFTIENGATEVVTELASEEEKRILRKVDYRLVPLLAFLYLVAFVDRSNSKYYFSRRHFLFSLLTVVLLFAIFLTSTSLILIKIEQLEMQRLLA
jgi:hypothetical protein